jgi:hypothetical protein
MPETAEYDSESFAELWKAVFQRQFVKHRRQYLSAVQSLKNDVLLRQGLKNRAQSDVDQKIKKDEKGD